MAAARYGIGALARAAGTTVETVRYYERIGLLPRPARTPGNYRSYAPAHLERLSFVRKARALGFSLAQVRELSDLADHRERGCGAADRIARSHLDMVERKISDLERLAAALRQLGASCRGGGTVADCRIIATLARPA